MDELITTRLRLYPLTVAQLQLALADQNLLSAALALPIVADMAYDAVHRAMQVKVRKMNEAAPADHYWYTYWLMVLRTDAVGIGLVGFKGAPDPYQGEVEIGYGIASEYERQGYTTEAVAALVDWGLARPECNSVIGVTYKENIASQRVLQKVGMELVQTGATELVWRKERDRAA